MTDMTEHSEEYSELFLIQNEVQNFVLSMRNEIRGIPQPCMIVLWDDDKRACRAGELLGIPELGLGKRAIVAAHPTLTAMAGPLSSTPLIHKSICAPHVTGNVRCVAVGRGRTSIFEVPLQGVLCQLN